LIGIADQSGRDAHLDVRRHSNGLSAAIKVEADGLFQLKGKTVEVQVFPVPVNQKK
jgi:hypothetical protein